MLWWLLLLLLPVLHEKGKQTGWCCVRSPTLGNTTPTPTTDCCCSSSSRGCLALPRPWARLRLLQWQQWVRLSLLQWQQWAR
jgi:hypothetical protein